MPLRPGIRIPLAPGRFRPPLQTFTGRVIVRLRRDVVQSLPVNFPDRNTLSLRELGVEFGASALVTLLDTLGDPPTDRLVHGWTVKQTATREVPRTPNPAMAPVRSLNAYFSVDLRGRTLPSLTQITLQFRQLAEVESAFVEPTVRPASVSSDIFVSDVGGYRVQGYVSGKHDTVGSEESGVNAVAVWPQCDGSGVKFVDVETGWQLNHIELPQSIGLLDAAMVNKHHREHGTCCLGIVAARDDAGGGAGTGMVGIAPAVTIPGLASHEYSNVTDWEVVDAIRAAIDVLGPGDVLLLEIQTESTVKILGVDLPDGYPLEVVDPWLDAIRLAVLHGITVVEPAGNPGKRLAYDLGAATWTPIGGEVRSLDKTNTTTFIDSGAILVGACESTTSAPGTHERMSDAWFGNRIDCWAWGEDVLTTCCLGQLMPSGAPATPGCKEGETSPPAYIYFEGTSAAAAIIAGTVALMHEMYRKSTGGYQASPGMIRELLRDTSLGTKVVKGGSTLLGSMPDLGKIATTLDLLPDVYIRDSLADVGAVPSPVVSMSPDVFVLNTQLNLANPGPTYDDMTQLVPNDLVVPGVDNYVYLRISNLSITAPANGCDAVVYWAPPATLLLPADWNEIGRLPATVAVPASGHVLAGPVVWRPAPASFLFGGHGCFIAQLDHPDDPRPIDAPAAVTWDEFRAFIGRSNNVAWRNFNVASAALPNPGLTADWAGADFFMRGVPSRPERFDFVIEPSDLTRGARLAWRMPAAFFRRLDAHDGFPAVRSWRSRRDRVVVSLPIDRPFRFYNILLDRDERVPMSFALFPAGRQLSKPARVVFRQLNEGIEVGRITWEFARGTPKAARRTGSHRLRGSTGRKRP